MLAALRSGSFVTRQRVAVYSSMLLVAYVAAIAVLLASADGVLDGAGRPIGTDFTNVYAAGDLAIQGKPALAYDWSAHHAAQKANAGRADIPYYPWHYPPLFLLVAALLAALPYLAALFIYQAATLAAYLGVIRRITRRPEALLLAVAFPAGFVNITHGHNGFLSAALMGGALTLLDRRPMLAGAMFGCMAYKPQFGLLIPLALVAAGRWRAFAAATGAVLVLTAIAWLPFGSDTFMAYWHSLPLAQRVVLEGGPGFFKVQSIYAALRLAGFPASAANALQVLATVGLAAGLVLLWRSAAAFELKAAALIFCSLLATPYALDYDLVLLAPAIGFLAVYGMREGFAPYEVLLLALLWILPLGARSIALATGVSLSPILMLAAVGLIFYRTGLLQQATALLPRRA